MSHDAAREVRMQLAKLLFEHEESNSSKSYMWEDYGPDVHEEYAVFADRILEVLRSLGWQQFRWQPTGDVALGHVQIGYPVFSRDEQWVAFVPEPPAESGYDGLAFESGARLTVSS